MRYDRISSFISWQIYVNSQALTGEAWENQSLDPFLPVPLAFICLPASLVVRVRPSHNPLLKHLAFSANEEALELGSTATLAGPLLFFETPFLFLNFIFYYPLYIFSKSIKPKSFLYLLQAYLLFFIPLFIYCFCLSEKAYITGFLSLITYHLKISLCLYSLSLLS